MRELVQTNLEKCVGCNRCVRECPIERANLSYLDDEGNIKVKVDAAQCIACGACISVCAHGARVYADDTDLFFDALASGRRVTLLAAPSLKTNFPEWRRLLAWLRRRGVANIYDVSLGADICIWAHLRYIEANRPRHLITQPCPAIVSYCEKHRHSLLQDLSPVQSPMACLAVYLRQVEGETGHLAALSPCIAKANENDALGEIEYSVTFAKLAQYMEQHGVVLPEEESSFDHDEAGPGALFPAPGGFRENIEYYLGRSLRVERGEGLGVYRKLDSFAATGRDKLPAVYDVLNCEEGCNIGPGALPEQNLFAIQTAMDGERRKVVDAFRREAREAQFAGFDARLRPEDFLRTYRPVPNSTPEVTEQDIQDAFRLLDKDTFAKQNFNCGACGNSSCREMARRIALRVNIPLNCVVKSRDDAHREHVRNETLYLRTAEYIGLVHRIGENLLNAGADGHAQAVESAMCDLGEVFQSEVVSLWKAEKEPNGYRCTRRNTYLDPRARVSFTIQKPWPAHWVEQMAWGEPISAGRTDMEPGLFHDRVQWLRAVPVAIKGAFWGFLAFVSSTGSPFAEDEISVVTASGILIVSSILEQEMTAKLIEAREEALAGTRAKSDFLSRMSHEMRTPMNAIIGMTRIAEGADDMARLRHCLATIDTSGKHLLGLINDVLDMAKIEAGKFELALAPFSLRQMLERMYGLVRGRIAEKRLGYTLNLPEDLHDGWLGDELRLSQVVMNLMTNAIKFTPDEGEITVSVHAAAPNRLHFTVEDTGIGLTEEQAHRLFNAFEQADAHITTRFGGTGLGLVISKTIVEKMNGWIGVAGVLGVGSTFTFEVELAPCELDEQAPLPAGAPRDGSYDFSNVRILLAEDIAINREVFKALLEHTNIAIDEAENGQEAVDKFAAAPGHYDMIVMDIQMPVLDGYGATQAIRALEVPRAADIPIVAMTANAFREDVERCLAAGMNGHLTKPIDDEALMEAIALHTAKGVGG